MLRSYDTFREIQHDLQRGTITSLDLVKHYLSNINKKAHLNTFLSVYEEEALQRASEVDKKIKRGDAGRLAGLVVSLKDVLSYKNHPLQASSKILNGFKDAFRQCKICNLIIL